MREMVQGSISLPVTLLGRINEKSAANIHQTGYSFIWCKQEEVCDEVVSTQPLGVVASMVHTPTITFHRKNKKSDSSKKKKK